ncbi:MAG TPA: multidrug transporter, partial [Pseudomonas sp.]|nr:multidrug transporter [Pseudomonas sp.]
MNTLEPGPTGDAVAARRARRKKLGVGFCVAGVLVFAVGWAMLRA